MNIFLSDIYVLSSVHGTFLSYVLCLILMSYVFCHFHLQVHIGYGQRSPNILTPVSTVVLTGSVVTSLRYMSHLLSQLLSHVAPTTYPSFTFKNLLVTVKDLYLYYRNFMTPFVGFSLRQKLKFMTSQYDSQNIFYSYNRLM